MPNLTDYIDRMSMPQRMQLENDLLMPFGVRNRRILGGTGPLKAMSKYAAKGNFARAGAIGLKGAGRAFFPALGLYFTAQAGAEGWSTGGAVGAVSGMAKEVAINAVAFGIGRAALTGAAAVGGTGLAAMGAGALAVGGAAAMIGGGLYAGASASWKYHMNQLPLETAGSMSAFQTSSAATMRQRSVMNIQRSHLNARSAFGNEAEWAHIARYRGIGRRGTR